MEMSGLNELLDDIIKEQAKKMILADEDFAKRIRRLIDYTYGDIQEGEYEEIEGTCGHENGHEI